MLDLSQVQSREDWFAGRKTQWQKSPGEIWGQWSCLPARSQRRGFGENQRDTWMQCKPEGYLHPVGETLEMEKESVWGDVQEELEEGLNTERVWHAEEYRTIRTKGISWQRSSYCSESLERGQPISLLHTLMLWLPMPTCRWPSRSHVHPNVMMEKNEPKRMVAVPQIPAVPAVTATKPQQPLVPERHGPWLRHRIKKETCPCFNRAISTEIWDIYLNNQNAH